MPGLMATHELSAMSVERMPEHHWARGQNANHHTCTVGKWVELVRNRTPQSSVDLLNNICGEYLRTRSHVLVS